MIIIIVGNIGSGKSLSVVKDIVTRKQRCFTNFKLHGIPYTRLKYSHIVLNQEIEIEGKKKPIVKSMVNFPYWQKQKELGGMDLYLDEVHNIINSRRSMSKKNVIVSDFLSQIRKILGSSEKNNLYLISQKLKRIDVNARDLCHLAIKCEKQVFPEILIPTEIMENGKLIKKRLPLTIIWKSYFKDADALDAYENYGIDTCFKKTRFIGNLYFKYYESYELLDFNDEEYV